MAYDKQTWGNGPEGGTPLSADRLNHIESGVKAVSDAMDALRLNAPSNLDNFAEIAAALTALSDAIGDGLTVQDIDDAVSTAISALTKASVGLSSVDNTSDANKPVSTAQQTAINNAISALTKASVGLGNVDNTSDANKPVSTATSLALASKADLVNGAIPTSQIPSIALVAVVPVADAAARYALTSSQVQPGDIAVQASTSETFMLKATDPSQVSSWQVIPAVGKVQSVNGQQGVIVLGASDVGAVAVADVVDVTATDIPFTPNGNIAATNVQAAIQEVRDEAGVGVTSYTDEQAQDATAALFAAGSHVGVSFVYDDAGGKISAVVSSSGSAGSFDSISGGTFTTDFTPADSIYGGTF